MDDHRTPTANNNKGQQKDHDSHYSSAHQVDGACLGRRKAVCNKADLLRQSQELPQFLEQLSKIFLIGRRERMSGISTQRRELPIQIDTIRTEMIDHFPY